MAYLHRFTWLWALVLSQLLLVIAAPSVKTDLNRRNNELPQVWPPPQQISSKVGCDVSLNGAVTIVTGNTKDESTINAVKDIVSAAGGTPTVATQCTGHGVQIVIGTGGAAADAAKALGGKAAKGLDADGYVLASGTWDKQPTIVLNGVDVRGTFYAAQTLRQLVAGGKKLPGVNVRDWPLMPIRGSIEGFYGVPWSHQARLDQYVFYGKHKMNTYIYTPKDDEFLRANWRDLYGDADLKLLQELVETANGNHVDFTFALSPGNDLCYSSDDDFAATTKKFDQVRALGVSSFYIALDDIPLEFHCDSDTKKWPKNAGNRWIADAQAFYLNRVQTEYIQENNLLDLQTVPTNYSSSAPFPYKEEFGTKTNDAIRIQWTGEGVFSPNVTVSSVKKADKTYVTDNLYFWDNFPVNDGMPQRIFLNPLTGRDADLYKYLLGFTSNPMVQSYASMIALANYGDYTWNGPAYDATASWEAALWELAGQNKQVHNALAAFADINQDWPYRTPEVHAPELTKDVEAFWESRKGSYGDGDKALSNRLALLTTLPDVLPRMAMKPFAEDVAPWSTLAMQWATACQHMIAMLDALDKGNQKKADKEFKTAQTWVKKTKAKTVSDVNDAGTVVPNAITPETGDGVFDTFVANATSVYKGN